MVKVSIALLRLPDSRIVFQRRDPAARIGPGKLGFFGGHVEKGETFDEAIRRELKEETSLGGDSPPLSLILTYQLESDIGEGIVAFHLYEALVESSTFEVYEGQGAEVYSREEALKRDDLTTSVKYALEHIR